MHYEGNIIRPPSEANSILIQVTVGCSRNKCTFCGAYKGNKFRIKSEKVIMEDIKYASINFKRKDRVFLCDGDALVIPQKRLMKIMLEIKKNLPNVNRVGIYANVKSLKMKTINDLKELKNNGLGIIYLGLESGDDKTLKMINKGTNSDEAIKACNKVKLVGIKLSLTVLLGIAGKERSLIHAQKTGEILSAIDPKYVGALSLILVPDTEIYNKFRAGRFKLPKAEEMLKELRIMISKTNLSDGLFHANHASNYLPIRAKMPQDKIATLKKIDEALSGTTSLKPEWMRAL